MTDRVIRTLEPSEIRAANALFMETLHIRAPKDEEWTLAARGYQPDRTLGVFDGDALIGTARSMDAALTVPGGGRVETAAVTGVGVRADRTRRGVLRDLMRTQLGDIAKRGMPTATLHASEAVIYPRFGYGVATSARSVRVERLRARVRDEAPTGGEIEFLDIGAALAELPAHYARFDGLRPGALSRPSFLWSGWDGHYRRSEGVAHAVLHRGSEGVDGYAMYRVQRDGFDGPVVMHVEDMHVATGEAFADVWRFLLSVDLVDRIEAHNRPADEPLEPMLTDPRACSVTWSADDLWLRLVDVRAALAARRYAGDGRVVIEVRDLFLPDNSGRYLLSSDGVSQTRSAAQLRMDVAALAMLYLGEWRVSALVTAGLIEVVDPRALDEAERLLSSDVRPWCGTFF